MATNVFVWLHESQAVVCEENERKAKEMAKKYGVELKDEADFVIYGCEVKPGMITPKYSGTFTLKGANWKIDLHMGEKP